jgi:concanavalin A-like lectin/glucanase superfamily protein
MSPRIRLCVLLVLSLGVFCPQAAAADTLNGVPSSSWQTNGVVWSIAHANGVVYLGGNFTSVRPPGAPAGTNEVIRNRLAAFDAATGELLPFDPNVDGDVRAMTVSSDGSTLYVGGDFRTVSDIHVTRLVAFDTASGSVITRWKPTAWSGVRALEVLGDTLYVGGMFNTMSGQPRSRIGAVDAGGWGALRAFAPVADDTVLAIAASDDGSKLFVGGRFRNLNGQPQHAVAAVDPVSGATLPFPAASAVPPVTGNCDSVIKDLTTDATSVYAAAEGTGGGCFDGTFGANVADGSLLWRNFCLGATQSVEIVGGYLYKGSHAHDCSSVPGGFAQLPSGKNYHLLALNPSDGLLGPWYPATNGKPLGPEVFGTDGRQLFVGGDFTTVNNKAQQGFTRFAPSPDVTPPIKPPTPRVASVEPGTVKLVLTGTYDRNDDQLGYALFRDGSSTPIATWSASSTAWSIPTSMYKDPGLAPGSTHTYRLQASDGDNALKSSTSAAVTVAGALDSYAGQVRADFPAFHWRLDETSGTTAADATGNSFNGNYVGGVSRGAPGVVAGSGAVLFNGTNALVTSATRIPAQPTFSVEAWFRTTTRRGGKLVGFGNSQSGTSSNYDRHIYMTDAGRLIFGVFAGSYPGAVQSIQSTASYNDGGWHHVVGTLGRGGMTLFVDGAAIGTNPTALASFYNGYWRVGGDNLNGWPSRPTSSYFNGVIDEVAVYDYALTVTQAADRFALPR